MIDTAELLELETSEFLQQITELHTNNQDVLIHQVMNDQVLAELVLSTLSLLGPFFAENSLTGSNGFIAGKK